MIDRLNFTQGDTMNKVSIHSKNGHWPLKPSKLIEAHMAEARFEGSAEKSLCSWPKPE
jgi:hypothetical protein